MKIKVINGLGYQLDTIGKSHDPLDGKIIINHYGEKLYLQNSFIEAELIKLRPEQMKHSGIETYWVYQIK